MLKMNTQFGDMVITDDNRTIADKRLKEEITQGRGSNANIAFYDDIDAEAKESMDKSSK